MPAVDLSDAVIEYLAGLADKDGGHLVAKQLRSQSYAARGIAFVSPQHATWVYQPQSK